MTHIAQVNPNYSDLGDNGKPDEYLDAAACKEMNMCAQNHAPFGFFLTSVSAEGFLQGVALEIFNSEGDKVRHLVLADGIASHSRGAINCEFGAETCFAPGYCHKDGNPNTPMGWRGIKRLQTGRNTPWECNADDYPKGGAAAAFMTKHVEYLLGGVASESTFEDIFDEKAHVYVVNYWNPDPEKNMDGKDHHRSQFQGYSGKQDIEALFQSVAAVRSGRKIGALEPVLQFAEDKVYLDADKHATLTAEGNGEEKIPAIAHFAYKRPGDEGADKSDMYTYGGIVMFSPGMKILGLTLNSEISGWSVPPARQPDDSGGVMIVFLGIALVVIVVAVGALIIRHFWCARQVVQKEEAALLTEKDGTTTPLVV